MRNRHFSHTLTSSVAAGLALLLLAFAARLGEAPKAPPTAVKEGPALLLAEEGGLEEDEEAPVLRRAVLAQLEQRE